MSRRAGRAALAVAGAAILAVVIGVAADITTFGGVRASIDRALAGPYQPLGRTVDIGGRALYLDCRGAGSPTVILEAGMGSDSANWSTVIGALSGITRTCAYDRAGLARSEPRGLHTLADGADDLHRLLDAAGERPPFVLVAHSAGGPYSRVFGARYREDVAGIVMVDTFDPDLQRDRVHPLLGSLAAEYDAELRALEDLVARVESLDWTASEAQLRGADLSGLRLEYLVAPRFDPRLDAAANAAVAAAWRAARESLSPGLVHYEEVRGAGHFVHVDRPASVVDAVKRLLGR